MERKKLEALVWKHTHKDFKGKLPDGTKTVLFNSDKNGTCLVTLAGLTDEQLIAKLPKKVRDELAVTK